MSANKEFRVHILFVFALLVLIIEQFVHGRLEVAQGLVLSRGFASHWGGVVGVYLEWFLLIAASLMLIFSHHKKMSSMVIAFILFVGILQNFSNHALYLTLAFCFLGLKNSVSLLRLQCLLLYILAGSNKLAEAFYNGESFSNLMTNMDHQNLYGLLTLPQDSITIFATIALVAELVIPILLILFPAMGIVVGLALHLGFALFMPGLWGFLAIAIAYLSVFYFYREEFSAARLRLWA